MKWVAIGSIVVLALLFVAAAMLSGNEKAKLRSEGDRATAVVVEKYVATQKTTKRTEQTDRCFKLTFEADGKQIDGTTCRYVSEELYNATPVGAEVKVVYLAKTPTSDLALEAALAD